DAAATAGAAAAAAIVSTVIASAVDAAADPSVQRAVSAAIAAPPYFTGTAASMRSSWRRGAMGTPAASARSATPRSGPPPAAWADGAPPAGRRGDADRPRANLLPNADADARQHVALVSRRLAQAENLDDPVEIGRVAATVDRRSPFERREQRQRLQSRRGHMAAHDLGGRPRARN